MLHLEIKPEEGGGWVACPPHSPGTPIVGRGDTWLEAIGDYVLQTLAVRAKVFGEDGKPVPPSFFGPRYTRD